ncbi:MAG: glycerol-3-phosphate 1-O-acyltransferase PlsY [Firmicutes bacterium]|nr:glycerol-3-phosphate 1-O-acyltransferase PlsY [Bacillota bacterium]
MISLWILLLIPLAYLLGAVPFGYLVSHFASGVDIRQHGSGNIGATNVLRVLGPLPAAPVFVADAGKGLLASWAGLMIGGPVAGILCGVAAILGHNWSVFLRFRGGRGVATSLGVLVGLTPWAAVAAAAVWLLVLALSRYVSAASIAAALVTPAAVWLFHYPPLFFYCITPVAVLVIWRHKANIHRLLAGTEYRIGQRVPPKEGGPRTGGGKA